MIELFICGGISGVIVGVLFLLCLQRFHRKKHRDACIEEEVLVRFRTLVERYDEADRIAISAALDVRHMTEQEFTLVAKSTQCVLWHATVEEVGAPELEWALRVFVEESNAFVGIHDVPENYRTGAWYHGRCEEDMFQLAAQATSAILGGESGYQQEFQCRSADGCSVWFQENVRIEKVGPNTWRLFGVSIDITERKRAEEQRERLLKELQEALRDVKQLRGMLPMCAGCKKIRDDTGYWNRLETYFKEHADVEFSHGLCPECMESLYPEITTDSGENRKPS